MFFSEESKAIRRALGEFLQRIAFINRRWIQIDSCSITTVKRPFTKEVGVKIKDVNCPLESFCDLLGISANKANEYLCAAKLMVLHNRHKTMCPHKQGWEDLKSEFALDVEFEYVADIHYLGKRMLVMRIGCLCNDNPTPFTAKDKRRDTLRQAGNQRG
jgi:hypothetical protein